MYMMSLYAHLLCQSTDTEFIKRRYPSTDKRSDLELDREATTCHQTEVTQGISPARQKHFS